MIIIITTIIIIVIIITAGVIVITTIIIVTIIIIIIIIANNLLRGDGLSVRWLFSFLLRPPQACLLPAPDMSANRRITSIPQHLTHEVETPNHKAHKPLWGKTFCAMIRTMFLRERLGTYFVDPLRITFANVHKSFDNLLGKWPPSPSTKQRQCLGSALEDFRKGPSRLALLSALFIPSTHTQPSCSCRWHPSSNSAPSGDFVQVSEYAGCRVT